MEADDVLTPQTDILTIKDSWNNITSDKTYKSKKECKFQKQISCVKIVLHLSLKYVIPEQMP